MFVVFMILFLVVLYFFVKAILDFEEKRKSFTKFLEEKGDYYTLEKIGFYTDGCKTKFMRRVSFWTVESILNSKYETEKDEEYLDFFDEYKSSIKIGFLYILDFVLFCGFLISLYSFFNGN